VHSDHEGWWADDRLEAVEAAGAENKMHSISRQKVIEMELVETKVSELATRERNR
jgi:hypothetical protein